MTFRLDLFVLAGLVATAFLLTSCASTNVPIVEVREIRCPSQPPPDFGPRPALPDTGDLRDFEPYAYRIDGWGKGVEERQSAYRESWNECP